MLAYRKSNKEKIKSKTKKWNIENKIEVRKYKNEKYYLDPQYRLAHLIRSRVRLAIKNNQKTGIAIEELGCSVEEIKLHIEKQFKPGMGWDNWNYRGWHLDHIVPLSHFDLTNHIEYLKACHFTNIQPLWRLENQSKDDSRNITKGENK